MFESYAFESVLALMRSKVTLLTTSFSVFYYLELCSAITI